MASKEIKLAFNDKLQISYQDKAMIYKLNQLEYMVDDTLGHHNKLTGIKYLFNPEQYVDSEFQLGMIQGKRDKKHEIEAFWGLII